MIKEETFYWINLCHWSSYKEFCQLLNLIFELSLVKNCTDQILILKPGYESLLLIDIEYLNEFFSKEFSPQFFKQKKSLKIDGMNPNISQDLRQKKLK